MLSSSVGTSESGVHVGQVGHPRPEPVRRTAPPVAMIATCAMNEAQAKMRRVRVTLADPDPGGLCRRWVIGPGDTATL